MVGFSNSSNAFGPSRYVVGPVLGDGVFYTSIQTAINDASAAGGNTVLIRANPSPYVENINFMPGVDVVGVSGDGRVAPGQVFITGNHTMGSSGTIIVSSIAFDSPIGDIFTLNNPGPGFMVMAIKFCSVNASSGRCSVTSAAGGSGALIVWFDSQINSNNGVSCEVGANSAVNFQETTAASATAVCVNLSGVGSSCDSQFSILDGNPGCISIGDATSNFTSAYSRLSGSTGATVSFLAPGIATVIHNDHNSNNGTGFYVEGAAGTYNYGNDTLSGSARNIDPGITQSPQQWRPRATAGTSLTAFAGTASFDNTQFAVTDGFVHFTGVSYPWVDQPAPTTVIANEGNFFTGPGITLTLPAAPVQGDTCKFKSTSGVVNVIQANAGQALVTGSVATGAGGTTTSSTLGDAMELTFYAAGNFWIADSIIGVWTTV